MRRLSVMLTVAIVLMVLTVGLAAAAKPPVVPAKKSSAGPNLGGQKSFLIVLDLSLLE